MSHQPGTIYRMQPTSTGQLMVVSTGATLIDQNVSKSTAAAVTLKNHGLSILAPSALGVFTLAAPVLGCRKEVLTYSTLVLKVRTQTGGSINGSTLRNTFAISGTTKLTKQGVMIKLIGASTKAWYASVIGQSTLKTPVTLTSAT
jgi:hypothetical protein